MATRIQHTALQTLRSNQATRALEMVAEGKTRFEVCAYLGGIGSGELRSYYPTVSAALAARETQG